MVAQISHLREMVLGDIFVPGFQLVCFHEAMMIILGQVLSTENYN